MRGFKTVNDSYIEPISFTVPRRAETFQSDIFPPATGGKAALSADEWLTGKTALPPKIDFESIYEGNAPVEVPSDYKPPAAAPAPTPAAAPKREPEPVSVPAASHAPAPSHKDQKGSMAAAADKFNDRDEESDNESSSFEEISKPVQRSAIPVASQPAPTRTTTAAAPKPASPIRASAPSAATPTATSSASAGRSAGGNVEQNLEQIMKVLDQQTKMISSLTNEVEGLKKRVGSGSSQDQSERIRQLELELESYR